MYEFNGCFWHGHTCLPFRDVATLNEDALSERYEKTMATLERIKQAGYQVEVEWECHFDSKNMPHHPELKTHPVVQHSPLNTRDALYGGRTEAMRLHYKIKEGESIQYVDVMSLYPFVCKYFKFSVSHPVLNVGDACRDIETLLQKEGLMKCCILRPEPYITLCYRFDVTINCYFVCVRRAPLCRTPMIAHMKRLLIEP